ncbi:CGNR zinc finger domain-containing protein [Burkholderia glumae]|uniref:CGNR zinc finger domain-containing protein n=1 Tax=Burkholderia glumae TaxID=337 RepID=UPI002150D226|nr:CGNR zinc finger domain-containing protein [Burkholderia glumae]
MPDHNQTAPGELEAVRRFINTWSIPNDTRKATDALPELARSPETWSHEFPQQPRSRADALDRLQRLRADLRSACEGKASGDKALNMWFSSAALSVKARWGDGTTTLVVETSEASFVGYIVAVVANAIAAGDWARLKTCPDCRWAFYDHTRNGKKRWCGMTKGGPGGRACGTIAKVAAYRAREATKTGVA